MKVLSNARLYVHAVVILLMIIVFSTSVIDTLAVTRDPFSNPAGIVELQQPGRASDARPGVELAPSPVMSFDPTSLNSIPDEISNLYQRVNPAIVSLQAVFMAPHQQIDDPTDIQFTAGSGFVYDSEGHILTNAHIVENADLVRVRYFNGLTAIAEIVGTDIPSNLAVLSVSEMPRQIQPLPLADSDNIQMGEATIAVGNPYGHTTILTLGAVRTTGRVVPAGLSGFNILLSFQTDSQIDPGNFGGPLLNNLGEVIGVNARLLSGVSRLNAGVGFAIPVNVIELVVPSIIEQGEYRWPWLGVSMYPFTGMQSREMQLEYQLAAYIDEVVQDSPAAQAGLQGTSQIVQNGGITIPVGGDVVIQVNGNPVTDTSDLLEEVIYRQPGETITLTIIRHGEQKQIEATLEPLPESPQSSDLKNPTPGSLYPLSGNANHQEFEGIDLPDLQAMLPTDLQIDFEGGNKMLRFSITFANSGHGPMELRSQTNQGSGELSVRQYLIGPDRMVVEELEGSFNYSQSHGHTHWQNFALYEIWTITPSGELRMVMVSEDKVGFCLLDLEKVSEVWLAQNKRDNLDIQESPVYTNCDNNRQGISVGWLDTYKSHLPGQALNIETLNNGVYALRSTLDPDGVFIEAESENNSALVYFLLHDDEVCVIGEEFSQFDLCELPSQ